MHERNVAEVLAHPTVSIIGLIDAIIEQAQARGASDIHIDPDRSGLRMRLRVDGVLQEAYQLPKNIHSEIISRIKVLAGMRTDEHQATQDGRFRHTFANGETLDMRVSIAPTYHGENAVLRLLSDNAASYTLDLLGFSDADRGKILAAIKRPHGMILSTGPTGSGKTTTLYTIIKMLNSPEVSIITTVGAYSIDEGAHAGYTEATSTDCSGTIALGETKTCTITNDDLPGTLHVVKRLINDNGGTAATSTFSFSVNQGEPVFFNENGQNDITVASSTYSVTETATSTYATTYRNNQNEESNDCSNLRIVNGGEATCTITNTFVPVPRDITPPVSTFNDTRDHQTINTELVQLSLSGQSTDNVDGDPKSGVASAAMGLYKLADAQTMDGEGFFSHTFPGLSCSTSTLAEQVPTEIIALSLTSVDPLTVSWDPIHQTEHPLTSLDRGVYCAVVHATDNAGNVEHTATAGPFAYTFTPSPTPTPTPPPSTPPVVNNGVMVQ